MKKLQSFVVLIAASISFAQRPDPLKLVDPMIGTGPEGHTFPGATAPFGMVQLSPEIIASADPDVILLTDFGYDRLGSTDQVRTLPGVDSTRAAKARRIFRVEEHNLVYIGPRTGENVLKLQDLIHAVKIAG